MRSQFENTVEDEMRELVEEHITPVPCVVLDHVVSFSFDPQVKPNECDSSDPSAKRSEYQKTETET
jgi:hypothetical protein